MNARGAIRTFLAVVLSDETKRRFEELCTELSQELKGFKWTRPDQLHLTLAFLGDVEASKIPQLISGLSPVVRKRSAFDAQWSGLGAFPKPERASILWAGVDLGRNQLLSLHREVADALVSLGFSPDSKFTPHVTLARAKRFGGGPANLKPIIDRFREITFGADKFSQVAVMSSECRPSGSVYTPMATLALG